MTNPVNLITDTYLDILKADADAFANREFGFVVGSNDLELNAIRHAYVSVVLTRYFGSQVSQYVGDLREQTTFNIASADGSWEKFDYPYKDGFKDLYNNHYARDAVIEHFGVRVSGGSIELNTIESLLAAGFRSGHLIVELSDPRVPQTRPTDLGTQRVLSPLEFYYGPRNPYVARCFSAGTPILLADGTSRVIEDILPGDTIAAFDETDSHGRADLRSATVARLLPGVTEEWIVLNDGTKVTPGHRYLTEHGTWMAAADLIASDIRAVAADGGLVPLRGTMLRASDANSDAEWITPEPFADAGNLVQPAPVFGWRTYNFEVAELHTYVAANDNDQQEPDKRAA